MAIAPTIIGEMNTLITCQHPLGGVQKVFKLTPGFGVSAVRLKTGYFKWNPRQLWDVAIIKFSNDDFELPDEWARYDKENLTWRQVESYLEDVKKWVSL